MILLHTRNFREKLFDKEQNKKKNENGDFCYIQINFSQKQPEKEILHEFIWHLVCLYISVAGTDLYS